MSKTDHIQIVIFDKDGTLFDCIPAYTKAFGEYFAKLYSIPPNPSEKLFLRTAGLPTATQVKMLCEQQHIALGRKQEEIEQKTVDLGYSFQKLVKETVKAPLFPDVLKALQQLKNDGKIIWISSSNSEAGVKADLERGKIKKYVDFYAGVSPLKPEYVKGEPHFRAGAKHIGRSYPWIKNHAVMIGDSEEDMRVGKKCGMVCIGRTGVFSAKQLTAAGATRTVSNFSHLAEILQTL